MSRELADAIGMGELAIVLGALYTAAVLYRPIQSGKQELFDSALKPGSAKVMVVSAVVMAILLAGGLTLMLLLIRSGWQGVLIGVQVVIGITVCWDAMWMISERFPRGYPQTALLARGIAALIIGSAWAIWPTWWLLDVTALVLGYGFMANGLGIRNIRMLALLYLAFMTYDVVAVYGTGAMIDLANAMPNLPIEIRVPTLVGSGLGLGLGDVVIPGLAIITGIAYGTWRQSILAYVIGLGIVLVILFVSDRGVPATIVLCPAVLLGLLTSARAREALVHGEKPLAVLHSEGST
jgi:presenilin-like A22 family membrane protease